MNMSNATFNGPINTVVSGDNSTVIIGNDPFNWEEVSKALTMLNHYAAAQPLSQQQMREIADFVRAGDNAVKTKNAAELKKSGSRISTWLKDFISSFAINFGVSCLTSLIF